MIGLKELIAFASAGLWMFCAARLAYPLGCFASIVAAPVGLVLGFLISYASWLLAPAYAEDSRGMKGFGRIRLLFTSLVLWVIAIAVTSGPLVLMMRDLKHEKDARLRATTQTAAFRYRRTRQVRGL